MWADTAFGNQVLLIGNYDHTFIDVEGCFSAPTAGVSSFHRGSCSQQSWKYALTGPLYKKFAEPCPTKNEGKFTWLAEQVHRDLVGDRTELPVKISAWDRDGCRSQRQHNSSLLLWLRPPPHGDCRFIPEKQTPHFKCYVIHSDGTPLHNTGSILLD